MRKYNFKSVNLPCNNICEFKDDYVDIICRVTLSEAPNKEYEKLAKEYDGDNYSEDCFYLEGIVGRDNIDEPFQTSGWMLYYVDFDGKIYDFGFQDEVMGVDKVDDAWNFVKKEIGVEF